MPMPVVSASRISPTMMMSGPARRKAFITVAEIEPALFDLHLAQALLRDLDRVFGGPDLGVRLVQVGAPMQRRRLARNRWAADEEEAVRLRNALTRFSWLWRENPIASSGAARQRLRMRITTSSTPPAVGSWRRAVRCRAVLNF